MPRPKRQPKQQVVARAQPLLAELAEAEALSRQKRWAEARDLLEAFVRRYPTRVDVLADLVNVYYELKNLRGYQYAAERLIALTPNDPDLMLGLAGAYLANLRPASALRTFCRVLERWPDHERAAEIRAQVGSLEGPVAKMLAEMGLAGEEGLDFAARHEQMQALLEQSQYRQARQIAEQLLRRRPDFVPVLNNLSQSDALEGRLDQAIATAERVLALDPDNIHALGNLVRYLCLRGRLDEARAVAERLKAAESEPIDVWGKKAEALSFLGDDQGVLDVFQDAERARNSRAHPASPLLFHLAAVAALRLGREDEARRYWQEALKIAPSLGVARANLDDLRKPIGERHAPWPFEFANWVSAGTIAELVAQVTPATRQNDQAVARAVKRYIRQHPEIPALVPLLLDRGDPAGREFALRIALMAETPELLAALRDFALSQRGPDALRQQAAQAAVQARLLPAGPARLWLQGEWREGLLLSFEVYGEAAGIHRPQVQQWNVEAHAALRRGDAEEAERLFKQALEVEPDAPDLLHNLTAAYELKGRSREAEEILRQIHERHPDYLFARVGLARLAIKQSQLDEARALIEPLLTRRRFHVSELAAFCSAQIELSLAKGNREAARSWLEMWAATGPDHPGIDEFRRRLGMGGLLQRLFGRT